MRLRIFGRRGKRQTLGRATLILAALAFQAVVLAIGWTVTFRIVRDEFARTIEREVIDRNAMKLDEVRRMLPVADLSGPVEYGSESWERLQSEIEGLTDLPGNGFACLLDENGEILCHPEIREKQSLRGQNLGTHRLRIGRDEDERTVGVGEVGDAIASGRVDFFADGTHYVATSRIPGTNLRLLLHHPQKGLLELTANARRSAFIIATVAGGLVLIGSGGGLMFLLRRYDSVYERLNEQNHRNLLIAQKIQRASLPPTLPELDGWSFAAWFQPADETGGDTYDVRALPAEACATGLGSADDLRLRDKVTMLLADASGHGVGPALAATQLHAMTSAAWRMGGEIVGVARMVNAQLAERLPDGRFLTAWFGDLDPATGELKSLSLGHGPLLLYRAAAHAVERFDADAPPAGVLEDMPSVSPRGLTLEPGDLFIVMSDGIIEAESSDGSKELFGIDRLTEAILAGADRGPDGALEAVRSSVAAFSGTTMPQTDDQTALIVGRDRLR